MDIRTGEPIIVINAFGERVQRVAATPVVQGRDFEVVWVCRRDEWDDAQAAGRKPEAVPFPAEDVSPLVPAV